MGRSPLIFFCHIYCEDRRDLSTSYSLCPSSSKRFSRKDDVPPLFLNLNAEVDDPAKKIERGLLEGHEYYENW